MPASGIASTQAMDWSAILGALAPYFVALVAFAGHILGFLKKKDTKESDGRETPPPKRSSLVLPTIALLAILVIGVIGILSIMSIVGKNSDLISVNQTLNKKLDDNRKSISDLGASVNVLSDNISGLRSRLWDTIYRQAKVIETFSRIRQVVLSAVERADSSTGFVKIPIASLEGLIKEDAIAASASRKGVLLSSKSEGDITPTASDTLTINITAQNGAEILFNGATPVPDEQVWISAHPTDRETFFVKPALVKGSEWTASVDLDRLSKSSKQFAVRALINPVSDLEHYSSYFKLPDAKLYSRIVTVGR